MFRASRGSSQIDLFSNIEQFLRERDQEKLKDADGWHNVFLDQVTKGIPEERFAELFDEEKGRPNAPIPHSGDSLLNSGLPRRIGRPCSDPALEA
jgi:hypothetical protein